MADELAYKISRADNGAFSSRHSSAQLRPFSTYRADLGALGTNVACVRRAPPGYYEHPPYDGISVYMALSRNVGRIDVGDGAFDMAAQAHEFVVGVPGSGGRMDSYRGGHGMQVVVSPKALGSAGEISNGEVWDLGRLHTTFHSNKKVSDLMAELARVCLAANTPDALIVDSLVLRLVNALKEFSDVCSRRGREAAPLDSRIVGRIVEFMDAHLAEQISLDTLAPLAGMPSIQFLRAFRNAVGETPYQHLLRRRLEAARLSLMTEESAIAEIAFACGFSSQQHLTGMFSGRFGISPAAFRKQVLSGEIIEHRSLEMA